METCPIKTLVIKTSQSKTNNILCSGEMFEFKHQSDVDFVLKENNLTSQKFEGKIASSSKVFIKASLKFSLNQETETTE
jgi:cytoskeletal protein CcmA (bactofilin family)